MEKDKIDEDFVETMLEIEKCYVAMNKHEKVRIEQWSKKLCQVTANPMWKKNRNKYAKTLLQLVKLGTLQEPFTKIPSEGPLPQFNGQVFIQPPKPRPKSSAVGHMNRLSSNSESYKQLNLKQDMKYVETPSFDHRQKQDSKILLEREQKDQKDYRNIRDFRDNQDPRSQKEQTKPSLYKVTSNQSLENPNFKNTGEKHDTRIQISSKVNEECIRLQTQLEIFQINEKHLREELSKRSKKIQEQADEIETLRRENDLLKSKLEAKAVKDLKPEQYEEIRSPYRYFVEKKHSEEDLLNIDDISHNLKRLEKLQEDLNKNKFS